MLSSQRCFGLLRLLPPGTVPCMMVFASPVDRVSVPSRFCQISAGNISSNSNFPACRFFFFFFFGGGGSGGWVNRGVDWQDSSHRWDGQ